MSFDLEKSIASWRRSFHYRRVFLREDIDELECHLRDHIAHLMRQGAGEEAAFWRSVESVGEAASAENEYSKVYWGKLKRRNNVLSEISWRFAMLKNYFKIAFRSLLSHKVTSSINITGLAIGLACCMVVVSYVFNETSYDSYHRYNDRLYRLSIRGIQLSSGNGQERATSPLLWGPALKKDYPQVEDYARFIRLATPDDPWVLSRGDQAFPEAGILHADPSALKIFDWSMISGDPVTALNQPESIVITNRMAAKYFGESEAMGQTIYIDPGIRDRTGARTGETFPFTVTGILEDIPDRSHFTFDFLLPSSHLNTIYGGDIDTGTGLDPWFWRGTVAHTYLLLADGTDPTLLETQFEEFQNRYVGDATRSRGYYYEPYLQRIDQIYLGGNIEDQLQQVGSTTNIYTFSIIAAFILLIACINFMNLSTARSAARAREVGLRKVVGAYRHQLATQFLGESLVTSFLAFVLAIGLSWGISRLFYAYAGNAFHFSLSSDWVVLTALLGIGLLTGLLAGSYPAFFLSRFKPVDTLKGSVAFGTTKGAFLRKGLIVFQFVVSAFLIIATLTVYKQLQYMREFPLGFDQERVLVIPPRVAQPLASRFESLRDELLNDPQVADVTMASGVPGQGGGGDLYVEKGASADASFGLGELFVQYNFVDMFDLELVAGRNFSQAFASDAGVRDEDGRFREVAAILNEEAVRRFGWSSPEEAIGKQIIRDPQATDWIANVIGVMKDFHFQSLHQPIAPGALILFPEYSYLAIKLNPGDLTTAIAGIEKNVQDFAPDSEFEYTFLDQAFLEQYHQEQQLAEIFGYISFLAIFIACMGLFGLAAFTAEQRIKEIGIRKTMGASMPDIVLLLSKGFAMLVLLAMILAVPLAYFSAGRWLENFAYHIQLGAGTFVTAALIAIAVAMLTVSYQTIKAALTNPIDSLRYE